LKFPLRPSLFAHRHFAGPLRSSLFTHRQKDGEPCTVASKKK
jgi:hypothetical protein